MTRTEILKAGGIEFTAGRAFPFGSEFAFVSKVETEGLWNIAFTFGAEGGAAVEAPEADLAGRRFVVIHECKKLDEKFTCLAMPVERIDEEASRIEEGIVAALLRNTSFPNLPTWK
jgi:hypothetical protein